MESTDVLFVNTGATRKRVYQNLSTDFSAIEPPFWAALTAGFIRNKGYTVDILDANAENLSINETANEIKRRSPSLTNIIVYGQQPAASTQLMGSVGLLCNEIKSVDKDLQVLLTGLHPSALPGRTIAEEACDFVGEGEGFHTTLGLLQNDRLSKIPGLWYMKEDAIFHNPRARNITDLDGELSDVAWELLPMDKYRAHNWQCLGDLGSRNQYASISTSLGCPFQCTFCSIHATFGEKKTRTWSPEWVLKQMDSLVNEYDVKIFKIIDETFVLNPKHFMTIADGLIERDNDLNIWAYARVDTAKKQYLDHLKKAGVDWLCLGIESGSEDVRQGVVKGKFDQMKIFEVVKNINKSGINTLGNYIFGLPEDDLASMQKTLDLAIKLNCEFGNFYSTMAYPGSDLYRTAVAKGWDLPKTWSGFSQHAYDCLPLPTNKISAKEVLQFRDKAFQTYFTNPTYLDMIGEKFGNTAVKHIEEMTKIKLKRKLLGD